MATIFPPAILGHDEQDLLKNSGLPAAAWVHDTRVVPDPKRPGEFKFQAMMGEAAPVVAQLINQRAYRKTSAEIYDEPPRGCHSVPGVSGKVLRAVAFLGGEQPKVKTLDDIPRFNDKGQSTDWVDIFATGEYDGHVYGKADLEDMQRNHKLLCNAGVSPAKFGEIGAAGRRIFMESKGGQPMEELRKKLIEAGMPEAVVTAMDDTALQAFAQSCAAFAATPTGGNASTGTTPSTTAGEGGGPAVASTGTGMGGMSGGKEPDGDEKKFSDGIVKQVLQALKVSGNAGEAAAARIKEIDAGTARRLFSDKVKVLLASGKIAPSVNEGGLIESIAADLATGTTLSKFGDKELSLEARFGLLIDRLEAQKPVPLSERAPSGKPQTYSESTTAIAKVEDHYDRFSDNFAKIGTSKETYVNGFKVLMTRGTTAEEYTGERD